METQDTMDFDAALNAEIAALGTTPAAEEQVVTTPEPEKPVNGEAKPPEPEKPKEGSLAKRLAMVAKEDKRLAADRAALEADKAARASQADEDARGREALARLERIRKAPSKVEAIREALGNDDEAVAELFLELNEWHATRDATKTPEQTRKDSETKLADLVTKAVEKAVGERDKKADEARAAGTAKAVEGFVSETHAFLAANRKAYRRCYMAPPDAGTIVAVGEGLHGSLKRVPTAEEVLKEIETYRASLEAEVAEASPESKTAAAAAAETSGKGKPTTPIRRDDAPVVPPRPAVTFEEELEMELKKEGLA